MPHHLMLQEVHKNLSLSLCCSAKVQLEIFHFDQLNVPKGRALQMQIVPLHHKSFVALHLNLNQKVT